LTIIKEKPQCAVSEARAELSYSGLIEHALPTIKLTELAPFLAQAVTPIVTVTASQLALNPVQLLPIFLALLRLLFCLPGLGIAILAAGSQPAFHFSPALPHPVGLADVVAHGDGHRWFHRNTGMSQLPGRRIGKVNGPVGIGPTVDFSSGGRCRGNEKQAQGQRSEEHTSELQSREKLVCRLLHEKKKDNSFYILKN